MLKELKEVLSLVHRPVTVWIPWAILGSCLIAGLDMLGVAAMLPMMQLLTGSDPESGVLGYISGAIGSSDVEQLLIVIALLIGAAFALKSGMTIAFRWWLLGKTTRLDAEAATELLRRYLLAPYWAHRARKISEIHRNLTTAVSQSFGQVFLGIISLISDLLTLLAIGIVLFFVSPMVSVFIVLFFVILGWGVQSLLKKKHIDIGRTLIQSDLEAWESLMPGVNGFRESRMSSSESMFIEGYGQAKMRRAHANRLQSMVSELPKYILEIGFIVGIGGISWLLFATNPPEAALGVLAVFAAASLRLLPTINRAIASIGVVRAGRPSLTILARELQQLNSDGIHKITNGSDDQYSGNISLENVSFHYPESNEIVIKDITLSIPRGSTTAFVGASGAGKSTLLDILLGLLKPTNGRVLSGDVDISTDLTKWYAGVGIVPQDVFLLDATLEQNIAFGVAIKDIDRESLEEAIRLSELDSLLVDLPDGLLTRMGERGVRLSGGQRQRVGIARALYRKPSVLILDEATSALDNATERRISDTIESLGGNTTVVIVAHRLSTVKNVDRLIFMANGSIEAEGTFDEVREQSVDFANLVSLGKLA